MQVVQVRSLLRELRSHVLCGLAKKKIYIYLKIRVTLKINKIHKNEPVQTIPSSRIASLHAFLQRPLAVSGEL